MSIRPNHQQFSVPHARAIVEHEVERLATLLAETERDLARLLLILDGLDGDADLEPEDGCEDDDAEPSLGAPERHPSCRGHGLDRACAQVAWGAGGDADIEAVWR